MGYKTCHVLNSSLDATACAKDCDLLRKQDFAKKCKQTGGLYKCCVNRRRAWCHECRYMICIKRGNNLWHHLQRHCCTLSLCTYPPPSLQNTSHQGPNGKSWSVFDDRVGWFSPIVYILVIFSDGAGAKRSEELNSKRGVLQLAVAGSGLSLPGSLQWQRPDKMEDLWDAWL